MGLTIADFIRDREPSLVRLKFLACLRNLNLPDTSMHTNLVMHDVHTIPFWLKSPCKPDYDKWGKQILAEKHEHNTGTETVVSGPKPTTGRQ